MRGGKAVQRPSTAPKSGFVPGIMRPTLEQLMLESQQKDVLFTQLALEESRTQLFLHAEHQRSEREKALLQQVFPT